jgi:hypothetical protein
LDGVPGILKRIAVIPPPVTAEQYTATRNDMETTGDITYVNGTHRAIAMDALTPGSEPKIVPAMIPNRIKRKLMGVNTIENPVSIWLNNFLPPLYDLEKERDISENPVPSRQRDLEEPRKDQIERNCCSYGRDDFCLPLVFAQKCHIGDDE